MSYAELHCKTNFSFLQGASHPDELVQRAAELGYHALAVTDVNSLAGVVRAHAAAKGSGLKLIVGAEITPVDAPAVVLWAPDRAAYGRLCRLITRGRRRAAKGECVLTLQDVAEHAEGLLAGVLVRPWEDDAAWPCLAETQNPVSERPGYVVQAALDRYRQIFSGRCYLIAEFHRGPDDRAAAGIAAATVPYRRTAAGRRRRRVLPHSGSPAAAARVDRHPARRHGGSSRRTVISQRPAAFEIAGRAARIVRPDSRRIATHARDRRSLYVFAGRTALRVSRRNWPRRE